ncbi:uncharacterized protein Z520_03616 [Fonsecaea multimorphosa CBS 102226]|uniref:GA4 desaturase n=1 Tax=Fonsecaea multimorphosa CBS 102226 TaxID=1442371 RepID=A0A0D2KCQ7_9EURO|nr:uncharacterized protein Z520_03616 [Fonsecaea multimorphosa CBS 102226]KIY00950.1 hypothetical protein Z520_03616 [Fonsecaea multimorphosa CBS 102226]OAL27535.1 hypothetical protein AYO22_03439 [Fonsecaea multimorphosa]
MSTTTTTTTQAHPSYSVALEGKDKDTLTASFNYWGSTSAPQESEIQLIFTGSSTELQRVQCPVSDMRAAGLSTFNLSTHGFQVLRHSSNLLPPQRASVPDFHDTDLVNGSYWPELASMLKTQLGVRCAAAINTTVRDMAQKAPDNNNKTDDGSFDPKNPRPAKRSLQPFFIVHGDYTAAGARAQMRAVAPTFFADNHNETGTTEAERDAFFNLRAEIIAAEDAAMQREGVTDHWEWSGNNYNGPRWSMLSVWRALEPVRRDPLAVLDPRSLQPGDVETPYVALQRVYKARPGFEPEFRSENMIAVAPEDGCSHQWYYISEQQPDEVYALKLFDSEAHRSRSRVAPWVAHSAFALPGQEDQPLRRSVEVRMLVIW